jgi:hypothetical protein
VGLLSVRPSRADEGLYRKVAAASAVIYQNANLVGGYGTGFLIDAEQRLVVTARHVLEKPTGGIVDPATVLFAQSIDGEIVTDAA